MANFRQFLTELSAHDTSSFPDDILRKYQWIFTKLSLCIDIVQIWFGMLMGKFRHFLTELSTCDTSIFLFQDNNFSKSQRIFTKLEMCIDPVEIWFGIAFGLMPISDRVISP